MVEPILSPLDADLKEHKQFEAFRQQLGAAQLLVLYTKKIGGEVIESYYNLCSHDLEELAELLQAQAQELEEEEI